MRVLFFLLLPVFIFSQEAYIAKGVKEIKLKYDGKEIVIKRELKEIPKEYSNKTLVGVIAPMKIDKNIETIGELEVLEYMKKAQNDDSILLVDARTPNWYEKIRIPTALNAPFTLFKDKTTAIEELTLDFGVSLKKDKSLDFSEAKTLIIYCNGAWCAQSLQMIKDAKYSLINLGYPKDKIKYYRGGMQSWVTLGLTTAGSKGVIKEE